jgi:hypothetical protein
MLFLLLGVGVAIAEQARRRASTSLPYALIWMLKWG